jgi:eukaryotic-like serine/threonine-protein kinase
MGKHARLPVSHGAPLNAGAEVHGAPRLRTRYYAFLSYSHHDKGLADWLHRELEKFRVPNSLAGRLTANGVVPRRLTPIFRDEHDLSAGGELADEIKAALAGSQFLIVLCSPAAAKSRWTNEEIESFKRTRPEGCVLAAVASGEPFASDLPGREEEECFPPALRYKYDRRGHRTAKRAEPLAADLRGNAEERRTGFLKLVAGMLGVGLDELVQRDTTRRHRQMAWLAAASLGGMAVTSTLAVTAFQARNEAREQRREAEGLVAFMLGDLKDKLEPIGKLDALDGVGSRVLAYYSKLGTADLTDAALSQRSQALSLMAQVADARGDNPTAVKLYRQAMAGTAEAMRRDPTNAQAVFDHAQNVFYVGQIAQLGGDYRTAENSMREYQQLARRMVSLQPDSMKYRMEEQYADADLGIVLYDQRRFAEAATQFGDALSTMEAITTADPSNKTYRQNLAEALAWLADAERAIGSYDRAIELRRRCIALYTQLYGQFHDMKFRERVVPALRGLGYLYAERGQGELAAQQFRTAIANADALTATEPNNAQWLESGVRARIYLAKLLLLTRQREEAATQIHSACQIVQRLLNRPSPKPEWRKGSYACLTIQAELALANGDKDQALNLAQGAVVAARRAPTRDKFEDAFRLARAYRLVGDVERERSDLGAARSAWTNGLGAIAFKVAEQPDEMAERAALLQRLGRRSEAEPLTAKLNSMGYRLAM